VSLTEVLISNLKQRISSLELVPGKGGCFELTVGDELVYSKLETDEFPNEDDLLKRVMAMVA
jgi:selenoprotein W-related protein